jgi:hypothetical protein
LLSREKVYAYLVSLVFLISCCALPSVSLGQADDSASNAPIGAGSVIVHSKFGGQIFGFDIDQNGTEGILSEAQALSGGDVLAAVETFDQASGKIISVVAKTQTQDDFVTFGVVGRSVGLVEHEHEISFLHLQRLFNVLNPLSFQQGHRHMEAPAENRFCGGTGKPQPGRHHECGLRPWA